MKKRGQAFLISTVVIIMILIAFVTIANYSKKTRFSTFSYVAEEIQIESEKVMDYALITGDYSEVDKFTKNISNYVDEDTRIYFITGDPLVCYSYIGESKTPCQEYDVSTNPINVTINNTVYEFPLTQGKHFYYVMIKEFRGEKYVYTNA